MVDVLVCVRLCSYIFLLFWGINVAGKIQQLENQLAEKEKVLTASSSRVKDLEETLAKLSSDSSKGEGELQESVKRLQTRVNALERDLDLKERDVHRLEQDKKTLEEKLADTGESSSSSFFGVRSESDAALKKRVEQLEVSDDHPLHVLSFCGSAWAWG